MKRKLDQYVGSLDAAGVAAGINAARENARRLVSDAKTLFDAGRYPSASAMAILAIEESGKCAILRSLSLAESEQEIRKGWRDYRSHTSKNAMWLLPSLVARGARRLADLASLFDAQSDHPCVLDHVKQIGFYTDCLGNAHWSSPSLVVDQALTSSLLTTADILSRGGEVSVREIELWVMHMKPVWKSTPEWRTKALANWYSEMQAEGLAPAGANEMETFVWPGLDERVNDRPSSGHGV